jgi:NADH-quinone oxidoreductase subunit E
MPPTSSPTPDLALPQPLEAEIDELISHYPHPRSASLMVLHALQDHFGHLPPGSVDWTARKLRLEPINILELVTFYPMFRQQPAGRVQIKICRTLSCALGGAHTLHQHLCQRLGLDPARHGLQTTPDGLFSVEFVECLASCGTAPVLMANDHFHEAVTPEQADALLNNLKKTCETTSGTPAP